MALELRKDVGEPVQTFTLQATVSDNVETVGAAIRTYLGIKQSDQQTWRAKAFDSWHSNRGQGRAGVYGAALGLD
ncbi:hypothetical protein [Mesorhizobium sp. 43Arga]